jgi:hypothetical protein
MGGWLVNNELERMYKNVVEAQFESWTHDLHNMKLEAARLTVISGSTEEYFEPRKHYVMCVYWRKLCGKLHNLYLSLNK